MYVACLSVVRKCRYGLRPQVSRQMLSIYCQDWTCLSNAMLECTLPAMKFQLKTVSEKQKKYAIPATEKPE